MIKYILDANQPFLLVHSIYGISREFAVKNPHSETREKHGQTIKL